MQNETTLSIERGLYSRLDKAADEIRLVTIGLCLHGHPLQCKLERVSLKDVNPDYASFVLSNSLAAQTPRQAKERWALSPRGARPDPPPNGVDQFFGSVPGPNRYRFKWGDFAALSYVWGDESERVDIILNDEVVSVTANLEGALRALAGDDAFGSRYKLWIDAICIN
jgi:hypothetical protein